ncbi:MAG: DUF3137 domain-containing protein [bacterium]|nr:DUF3137 domain-containing protein [bacterium]
MSLLKSIFRPSKDEIWKKLSDEMKANFVPGQTSRGGKVVAKVGEWTVTLDLHRVDTQHDHVVYTRLRAPFANKDGFRFLIYRQTLFSAVAKAFGMQDIDVGFTEFDRHYVIQGNDAAKVKALFASQSVRGAISAYPEFYGEVRNDDGWFHDEFPEGVDELYCLIEGEIVDPDKLKGLFDLFAELLNQLCHADAAYEDDPELSA